MADTIPVRVRPLDAEAFAPFGRVIEGEVLAYPESEEGRIAIERLRLRYRPEASRIDQLAIHFSYNQTFVPMTASMILVVAPPPGNRAAGEAEGPDVYELDYTRLAAFSIEPGQAAMIDKGAWHNLTTLAPECHFLNVTRKDVGEGRSPADELEGKIAAAHAVRSYVEFVDLCKRDGRVIQLEL